MLRPGGSGFVKTPATSHWIFRGTAFDTNCCRCCERITSRRWRKRFPGRWRSLGRKASLLRERRGSGSRKIRNPKSEIRGQEFERGGGRERRPRSSGCRPRFNDVACSFSCGGRG